MLLTLETLAFIDVHGKVGPENVTHRHFLAAWMMTRHEDPKFFHRHTFVSSDCGSDWHHWHVSRKHLLGLSGNNLEKTKGFISRSSRLSIISDPWKGGRGKSSHNRIHKMNTIEYVYEPG